MTILGLSFFYHDSAAVILKDGVPLAMADEERFSRKKHDSRFPIKAIDFVLRQANLKAADIYHFFFY